MKFLDNILDNYTSTLYTVMSGLSVIFINVEFGIWVLLAGILSECSTMRKQNDIVLSNK